MSELPVRSDPNGRVPARSSRTAGGYLGQRVGAAVDRALLRMMMTRSRFPESEDVERVGAEIRATHSHVDTGGYLSAPEGFHPAPDAPRTLYVRKGRHLGLRFSRVSFDSGFEPTGAAPVRDRWLSYRANRTAHACVLRHDDDKPRPWLFCLHGLGTGAAWMDLPAFRAQRIHQELGVNVVLPLLPLHGARRERGMHRGAMLSFELVDTVQALAQAVWDVRRLLAWARQEGADRIGLFGLSVGAYTASLVAGLEPCDLLLAGIPFADIPSLYDGHTPPDMRVLAAEHGMPDRELQELFRVVSPHSLRPRAPLECRYIFAGLADHVTPPAQAEQLWELWDRPTIEWFDGGHVSFYWSKPVDRFIDRVMYDNGFVVTPEPVPGVAEAPAPVETAPSVEEAS